MDVGSRLKNGYVIGSRFMDDFDIDPVVKEDRSKRSICYLCKRLGSINDNGVLTCDAFPSGIPNTFLQAKADHTAPYDGDNGLTFLP